MPGLLRCRFAPVTILLGLLMLAGCQTPGADATATRRQPLVVTGSLRLELTGPGLGNPQAFSYADVCALPMTTLSAVLTQRSHPSGIETSWRGPSLELLFSLARINAGPQDVTIEAVDGYVVRCRLDDLAGAILALQDGTGRPLRDLDDPTPWRLVPPKLTGNYWVQNVMRITVEPLSK